MTLERSRSKVRSAFVEAITHREPSNESLKMRARLQSYELELNVLLRRNNHLSKLRQTISLELN